MLQRTSTGFAAGLILGLVIVGSLVGTGTRVHDEAHAGGSVPSDEAAQAFIDDWQRMRNGTWTVDSKFIRSNGAGETLTSDVHEAQHPPEHMRTTFGTTTIDTPGKTLTCAPAEGGQQGGCRTVASDSDFQSKAESEIGAVRSLVTGTSRQYSVTQTSKHCYSLQTQTQVVGTWGQSASFCFDAATGATVSSEVVQTTGTDRITSNVTATSVTGSVKESDFQEPKA